MRKILSMNLNYAKSGRKPCHSRLAHFFLFWCIFGIQHRPKHQLSKFEIFKKIGFEGLFSDTGTGKWGGMRKILTTDLQCSKRALKTRQSWLAHFNLFWSIFGIQNRAKHQLSKFEIFQNKIFFWGISRKLSVVYVSE